jgi:hypothetical protein
MSFASCVVRRMLGPGGLVLVVGPEVMRRIRKTNLIKRLEWSWWILFAVFAFLSE